MLRLAADDASKAALTGWLAMVLLAAALIIGGGGTPAPRPELALECFAALIAVLWVTVAAPKAALRAIPRSVWLIAAVLAGLPLAQLIPLPPAVWQALPGREIEREALSLIDQDATWRPWTVAPLRTLSAFLSLGPPLLLLLLTAMLGRRARLRLVGVVAAVGLLSIVIGALQLLASDDSPLRFYGLTTPQLTGFQANHNSTADLLLIALVAVSVLLRAAGEQQRAPANPAVVLGLAGLANALFVIGVVLTASRMGIFLLPVALLASLWILRPWLSVSRRMLLGGIASLAVLALLVVLLARGNAAFGAIAARFDFTDELRPQLWQDGLFVVRQHLPFGVGMGNFAPALVANERIEAVRPFLTNRAHNDFIELAAEAGLFGMLALAAISGLLGRAIWRAIRSSGTGMPSTAVFALATLLILALHSLVDYPLRSMSLAGLAAVCAGLLLAPRSAASENPVAGDKW